MSEHRYNGAGFCKADVVIEKQSWLFEYEVNWSPIFRQPSNVGYTFASFSPLSRLSRACGAGAAAYFGDIEGLCYQIERFFRRGYRRLQAPACWVGKWVVPLKAFG